MGISIENLSYAYGETAALEDGSLAIDPGWLIFGAGFRSVLGVSIIPPYDPKMGMLRRRVAG